MTALEFYAMFIGLIFIGAFFIVGWYGITRGSLRTLPDGTTERDGFIFMGWSLFWEHQTGTRRIQYIDDALRAKIQQLSRALPRFQGKFVIRDQGNVVDTTIALTKEDVLSIENALQCKVENKDTYFYLYDAKPIYRFPDFLRSPLSQCPKCMASVYGSLVWWSFVLLQTNAFAWTAHVMASYFVYWVIYCVSLSCVNMIVYKKQF